MVSTPKFNMGDKVRILLPWKRFDGDRGLGVVTRKIRSARGGWCYHVKFNKKRMYLCHEADLAPVRELDPNIFGVGDTVRVSLPFDRNYVGVVIHIDESSDVQPYKVKFVGSSPVPCGWMWLPECQLTADEACLPTQL